MNKNKNQGKGAGKEPASSASKKGSPVPQPQAGKGPEQSPDRSQQPQDKQSQGGQTDQSGTKQSGEWQRPVTNQDEQRKPTNAGISDAPMGEEETEGDPGQERIKPYKNIGDDSEETEKKTPSMES